MEQISNNEKIEFINDNSDMWIMNLNNALIELSNMLNKVDLTKYEVSDYYIELDLAEAIKNAVYDNDMVAVGKEYAEYWEPITQQELDDYYNELKKEAE